MNEHRTARTPTGTDRRESEQTPDEETRERVMRGASVAIGSALLVGGLRRRSIRGAAMALAGAGLLIVGLGETSRVTRALGSLTAGGDGWSEATGGTEASRSITVDRAADELHELWRDPDQLSKIVGHVADVTALDEDRLRWTVDGPRGREISWETRIVEDEPGKFLRWETPGDAALPNEGSVQFHTASGGRGTVVTLAVSFDPPGGTLGNAALERLSIVPETFVGRTLSRFKSLVESGEIPTLEGNPSGRGKGDLL